MSDKNKAPAAELLVVETTGEFMLSDVSANQEVQAERPSLVKRTAFITQRLDNRQLRVVEDEVDEKLTDADVEAKWRKGGYSKSQKKTVTPPQANANKPRNEAPKPIPKGAPKQPGESQEAFEARLKAEDEQK